jgi:hypothetical protein
VRLSQYPVGASARDGSTATGTLPIDLGAKSLILRVYDVLMTHRDSQLVAKSVAHNLATASWGRRGVARVGNKWGNFGLCWCRWQTVGSAPDEKSFTVSRTGERGVLWCRS